MAKASPIQTKKPKLHIRKGDMVRVLSGKDRGTDGRVMGIVKKRNIHNNEITYKAIVEGKNMVTRHRKPDAQNPQGSILKTEAGIHLSKLMLLEKGKPTRIGRTKTEKGWVRVSKKTGEIIK